MSPSADLGLGDVTIRRTVTEEDYDEGGHIKDESQPQATRKSLHPSCNAPASLDSWGEQSTVATRDPGDGGESSDSMSLPSTRGAADRVVGDVGASAVGVITLSFPALDSGVPSPVLVRGAKPVINAINLQRFRRITGLRFVAELFGKGLPVGVLVAGPLLSISFAMSTA